MGETKIQVTTVTAVHTDRAGNGPVDREYTKEDQYNTTNPKRNWLPNR